MRIRVTTRADLFERTQTSNTSSAATALKSERPIPVNGFCSFHRRAARCPLPTGLPTSWHEALNGMPR